MPRTGRVEKRQIAPDPIYQNPLIAKLINKLMVDGKKALAHKIVYEAFREISKNSQDPIKTFEKALDNVTPKMEVRPRRVGGASYMIPMEVRGLRKQSLALAWLTQAARSRGAKEVKLPPHLKNKPLIIAKLAAEILDAAQGGGKAVAKKEEIHRIAEANRAFAHFRW